MNRFEMIRRTLMWSDSETPAIADRFFRNTDIPGDWAACWRWKRATNHKGYGQMSIRGDNRPAHRVAYALAHGGIEPGLPLDHLCRVRNCVNPLHLEVVTTAENNRRSDCFSTVNSRKTHCPKGHPYDNTNTYITPTGSRACRRCAWARDQARYAAQSAARKAAGER